MRNILSSDREGGDSSPTSDAEAAFDPDGELLRVARSTGVLVALAAPQGGLLAGSPALLMLDGRNGRDMTLAAPVAMHMSWPGMNIVHGWNVRTSEDEQRRNRDKALTRIQTTFDEARAYLTAHGGPVASPPRTERGGAKHGGAESAAIPF